MKTNLERFNAIQADWKHLSSNSSAEEKQRVIALVAELPKIYVATQTLPSGARAFSVWENGIWCPSYSFRSALHQVTIKDGSTDVVWDTDADQWVRVENFEELAYA